MMMRVFRTTGYDSASYAMVFKLEPDNEESLVSRRVIGAAGEVPRNLGPPQAVYRRVRPQQCGTRRQVSLC